MKGNPIKLGSIASKSAMKLKDKVMKMKKEAAMKMKKESMAKMKEAMAKMKKDPMMMKKGSPMEMKKAPTKKALKGDQSKLNEGLKAAIKAAPGKMKKGEPMNMKKGDAMKMKKGQPMKQKMNMVKGPDGKMVPDFAVDGKGANDMKKSPAKIAKPKTKNKTGRLKPVPSKKTGKLGDMTKMSAADRKKLVENMGKSGAKMKKASPAKKTTNLPKGMVDFNNPAIRKRYNTDKDFRDYLKKQRGITYDEKTRKAKKVVSSFGKPFKPTS